MANLARDIRTAGESNDLRDPYDLAGFNEPRLIQLVNDTFGTPIPVRQMVRFSFLVGGGQKMRQKYDADCSKHFAAALRALGYEEDRGAAEDLACQGSFKHQHDTDKNIMTVHVFPRVEIIEDEDAGEEEGALDWKDLPPEYLMTVCSPAAFKHLAKAKTPSWTQKKRMLEALKEMHGKYEAVEAKMVAMEPCSADETKLYESSSLDNLQEKADWLQGDMKAQVDAGQLTAAEQGMLLEQAQTRHAEVAANLAAAEEAGQAKKVAKLTSALEGLTLRQEKLRAVEPIKHKLKHQSEMKKLRKELALLDASFDPGRPMKMEKIQAQLDELETEAAECARTHTRALPASLCCVLYLLCLFPHHLLLNSSLARLPAVFVFRHAGGSMRTTHGWQRLRRARRKTQTRSQPPRRRRTRVL